MNQRTTTPPPGTRIALVEDHVLFAESLDIALTIQGHDVRRIDLPEHTRSVNTLLPAILRANPRIVLLDLDLGTHGNGVRLIEPLARAGIAVVVVTGNADHVLWGECMRNGARRVIPKSTRLNEIIATVRRICNGLPVVEDRGARGAAPAVARAPGDHARAASSPRAADPSRAGRPR